MGFTYDEFDTIIQNLEHNGRDVAHLRQIQREVWPQRRQSQLPGFSRYREEPEPVYSPDVVEMDRRHSLVELREMCRQKHLSVNGDKKTLATRLIEGGSNGTTKSE